MSKKAFLSDEVTKALPKLSLIVLRVGDDAATVRGEMWNGWILVVEANALQGATTLTLSMYED